LGIVGDPANLIILREKLRDEQALRFYRGAFSFMRRANGIMSTAKGCIIVGRPVQNGR
jgi:hypothetical protein